tara:strand:+ start:1491 stop:1916 length:426 start_codon:yes stop_codon:yes gene_type:complete
MRDLIERLEEQLSEGIAMTSVPLMVDPNTFMGMGGLSPSTKRNKKKCDCPDAPHCRCAQTEVIENNAPTKTYVFTGDRKGNSDKKLALGYHFTKFFSLLQRMIAPLPITNKSNSIEVVASPALEQGLKALADREGLTMSVQ